MGTIDSFLCHFVSNSWDIKLFLTPLCEQKYIHMYKVTCIITFKHLQVLCSWWEQLLNFLSHWFIRSHNSKQLISNHPFNKIWCFHCNSSPVHVNDEYIHILLVSYLSTLQRHRLWEQYSCTHCQQWVHHVPTVCLTQWNVDMNLIMYLDKWTHNRLRVLAVSRGRV